MTVLSCGTDLAYRHHDHHLRAPQPAGLLVSEYPPGTRTRPQRVGAAHRLLATLSRATVLVETDPNCSNAASITWAQRLGRNAYAVPGQITSPTSRDCNHLIADRDVTPVTSPRDISSSPVTCRPNRSPDRRTHVIDTFAWTLTPTSHGGTELALIAASPTAVADPIAESVPAHPITRETRDRVRAGLINSDAEYPHDPYRLYRLGGCGGGSHQDLAAAVTVHQLAVESPWHGILDHVVFLAELGLDGSLRPRFAPPALATLIASAARTEFRYVVIARPEHTDDLDRIEAITVVALTDLREVLSWLETLPSELPAPTAASPASPGTRIAHNLGPDRVRALQVLLDRSDQDEEPAVGPTSHPDHTRQLRPSSPNSTAPAPRPPTSPTPRDG